MAAFFNSGTMKIGLTIKSIVRWEQLRKKSFSLMDYSDREDVDALLYTTTICNSEGVMYTLDVFRKTLSNEKLVREMVSKLEREIAVLSQFQKKQESTGKGSNEGTPEMIGSIVSTLVMSGLDAYYAFNEMELCDLPLYIEAYEKKRKEDMESARIWTYLTILPHIDARKMKNGARDLIIFPWEEEEMKKDAERVMRENEDNLKKFLAGELFDINKVNWSKREDGRTFKFQYSDKSLNREFQKRNESGKSSLSFYADADSHLRCGIRCRRHWLNQSSLPIHQCSERNKPCYHRIEECLRHDVPICG